jgi:hypothetical protein
METRRIRRLERRRTRRVALAIIALAGLGLAVGLALPRNQFASALLSGVAIAVLVVIALRDDAIAPTHGLRHVVRLPVQSAVSATLESFWSRFVGTIRARARALVGALPRSTPVPLELDDALDDEAEAWWGTSRERLMSTIDVDGPGGDGPGVEEDREEDREEDPEDLGDASLVPSGSRRLRARVHRQLVGTRRLFARRKGEPNVAGDSPSGEPVEAGTLSARST